MSTSLKTRALHVFRLLSICGPYISHDAFPLNDKTRFFILFSEKYDFFFKDWSRHLFLFYFFEGKQNMKENPKFDSLVGKDSL